MDVNTQILSDITVHMKYARYLHDAKRRETWDEIVDRNKWMHLARFPDLADDIKAAYKLVYAKQGLPAMRSMQFGGRAMQVNPTRGFGCSFMHMDDPAAFSELMFLLLSGVGVGYSVQRHHVDKLPPIGYPPRTKTGKPRTRRFLIGDSIEGWADAVKVLLKAYFTGAPLPAFDFSDIRPKGQPLITSGGRAPGPEPLREALFKIQLVLDRKAGGEQLTPLEVHDINCHLADAVLSGGIRRAAMMALFCFDDEDMLTCKFGKWYETEPQRARANNSVVILRHRIQESEFLALWEKIQAGGSGEPSFFMSNDAEQGLNPSLRAGTRVLTDGGIFSIEELEGKTFTVKNLYGQQSKAHCWLSGTNEPLYKITLQGGREYYATAQHEWPVHTRFGFRKTPTISLKPKDKLPRLTAFSLFDGDLGDRGDGFLVGWLYGDGWICVRSDNGAIQYGMVVSKEDAAAGVLAYLNQIFSTKLGFTPNWSDRGSTFEINLQRRALHEYFTQFGVAHKSKGLPSAVWRGSEEFRRGFIDGFMSADGCIAATPPRSTGTRRPHISLTSSHINLVRDWADLLGFYGIRTDVTTRITRNPTFPNGKTYNRTYTNYRVKVANNESASHFAAVVSLTHATKQAKLTKWCSGRPTARQHCLVRVVAVEKTDLREKVWDISVWDTTHCFQLAHCITGNCGEISLRPNGFCNLGTLNTSNVRSQADLERRAAAIALIATLQASYTDFHYLRDVWRQTTERDALIGVSMTGIASGQVLDLDLKQAAQVVVDTNADIAARIGINPAARCTTVKPEGTSSLVLGSSSGIHAWHAEYYIRRIRVNKTEPIYGYLAEHHPELVEDEFFKPHLEAVISVPVRAPKGAITRSETALQLLNRVYRVYRDWIKPGHRKGHNHNNVSTTVTIKPHEWERVGRWMWENREHYTALSVLPYSDHGYVQAPFEEIDAATYRRLTRKLEVVDLTKVIEDADGTNLVGELACAGGACEI